MKLRNKKTGEIGKLHCDMNISPAKYGVFEDTDIRGHYWEYDSLAELNAEWEDYEPKEPLIKDEKVRKAVRAWAEANNFLDEIEAHSLTAGTRFSIGHYDIEFLGYFIYDLESNKTYTIAELCGEEEE